MKSPWPWSRKFLPGAVVYVCCQSIASHRVLAARNNVSMRDQLLAHPPEIERGSVFRKFVPIDEEVTRYWVPIKLYNGCYGLWPESEVFVCRQDVERALLVLALED